MICRHKYKDICEYMYIYMCVCVHTYTHICVNHNVYLRSYSETLLLFQSWIYLLVLVLFIIFILFYKTQSDSLELNFLTNP